MVVEMENFKK